MASASTSNEDPQEAYQLSEIESPVQHHDPQPSRRTIKCDSKGDNDELEPLLPHSSPALVCPYYFICLMCTWCVSFALIIVTRNKMRTIMSPFTCSAVEIHASVPLMYNMVKQWLFMLIVISVGLGECSAARNCWWGAGAMFSRGKHLVNPVEQRLEIAWNFLDRDFAPL